MSAGKLWDIFCKVIDNYGDLGVSWRLASGLAVRGQRVRLWVDEPGALQWMAPQGATGVEVRHWTTPLAIGDLRVGEVLVEAFGCQIAPEFIAAYADQSSLGGHKQVWINVEYLSAQAWAGRCHGLPSPVMDAPGADLKRHYFFPGFDARTGGLLREPDLCARQARFDRNAWLARHGIDWRGEQLVCLFCYEPQALGELLRQLAASASPTRLLVTAGRASAAVKSCINEQSAMQPSWNKRNALSFSYLPNLTQVEFDHLLWACDVNFVRGEDSLVRALWAGRAFIWHIYPQSDQAHRDKLEAWLDLINAPASLREFHRVWNALSPRPLPALDPGAWQATAALARAGQLAQDDLVTRLLGFVEKSN